MVRALKLARRGFPSRLSMAVSNAATASGVRDSLLDRRPTDAGSKRAPLPVRPRPAPERAILSAQCPPREQPGTDHRGMSPRSRRRVGDGARCKSDHRWDGGASTGARTGHTGLRLTPPCMSENRHVNMSALTQLQVQHPYNSASSREENSRPR